MTTTAAARLRDLRGADLRGLHAGGSAPESSELTGPIEGAVLNGSFGVQLVRGLRVWARQGLRA